MTSKLVTAFIDNGDTFESFEEAVMHFDGSGRVIEGVRRNEGRDSNGLNVGKGFGFNSDDTQVHTFTVEYKVTEEYAVSLIPEPEVEDGKKDAGDNPDDIRDTHDPTGEGSITEGPSAPGSEDSGVYEQSPVNPEESELEEEQDNGNSELEDGDVVRPSEPESDSGLDEGVEPTEPVETDVDEQPEPPGDDEIAVPGELA